MINKKNRMLAIILRLIVITALFLFVRYRFSAKTATYDVVLGDNGFTPSQLTIKKGDTIKFSTTLKDPFWPASNPHPLHDVYSQLDAKKPIGRDESWTFKADKVGEWGYHDHLSPSFKGKLIVISKKGWEQRNRILKRDEMFEMIKRNGPEKAYTIIKGIYDPSSTFAHSAIHLFGEVLYANFGLNGIEYCDNFAGFGCYHGFFIKAVGDQGLDVAVELDKKCIEKFGLTGLGCPHGIGHGLVEYFGLGKIKEALSVCAKLSWKGPLFGCAGGVFMENNFPTVFDKDGVGKVTIKDAHGNLFEPCLSVPANFREACYFEQASWWNKVLDSDYAKIGRFCISLKVTGERESCFLGLGNSIAEQTFYNSDSIIEGCRKLSDRKSETVCRSGAAWAFFANPDKRFESDSICSGLGNYEEFCLQRRILVN